MTKGLGSLLHIEHFTFTQIWVPASHTLVHSHPVMRRQDMGEVRLEPP